MNRLLGPDVGAERIVDEMPVIPDEPDRGGAHALELVVLLNDQEDLQQRERVSAEDALVGNLHEPVHRLEATVDGRYGPGRVGV